MEVREVQEHLVNHIICSTAKFTVSHRFIIFSKEKGQKKNTLASRQECSLDQFSKLGNDLDPHHWASYRYTFYKLHNTKNTRKQRWGFQNTEKLYKAQCNAWFHIKNGICCIQRNSFPLKTQRLFDTAIYPYHEK